MRGAMGPVSRERNTLLVQARKDYNGNNAPVQAWEEWLLGTLRQCRLGKSGSWCRKEWEKHD